ncbi:GNAT family N-acetyltransferase [Pleurocapsales cyanobacterium LEGE 10410]|nr:GNAT family N-acetyltransferase [Pleurocapsales cyanobacterium LEGE 10410]
MERNNLQIRQATAKDARSIGLLAEQLGYSISEKAIQKYLKSLATPQEWIVYIACKSESILGWINIYLTHGILADRQAEIGGLIVDRNFRGYGIGRLLLQRGETWAQQQGCNLIQVRSRTTRQQAHTFYQDVGYEPYKTQLVLRKQLNVAE